MYGRVAKLTFRTIDTRDRDPFLRVMLKAIGEQLETLGRALIKLSRRA